MQLRSFVNGAMLTLMAVSFCMGQPQHTIFPANGSVLRQSIKINDPGAGTTSYTWNPGTGDDIGRRDDGTYYNRFRMRTVLLFGSIPRDARVDSVKLTLTIWDWSSGSSKASIVKLPATYSSDANAWSQFDSPLAVYFTSLQYDQTSNKDLKNPAFTADVTNAIHSADQALTFGIMSQNESTNNTDAKVTMSVTVYWTPKIVVTVRNSFDGGMVEIDGSLKSSPWTSGESGQPSWYSGDSHNIRAYTQQVGQVIYPFPEPGSWSSTCNQDRSQTNNNTPVVISPTTGCTFTANFGQATVQVTVDQKLTSTGASIDSVGRWQGGPDFVKYAAPANFTFNVPSTEVLRGSQDILSGQKYSEWLLDNAPAADVTNHHIFSLGQNAPSSMVSNLKPTTQGSVIKMDLIDAPGTYNGSIQFKDPWLIDSADATYGNNLMNRGMNALFKSRTSPFSPDFATSYGGDVYGGVFLDQEFAGINPVYYSVGAPSFNLNGITYNLHNWAVTSGQADFQNANAAQTGVVFRQASTTVTGLYKAHLASNTSAIDILSIHSINTSMAAPFYPKFAAYPSAGEIWFLSNDGSGWSNEIRISSGNGGNNHVSMDTWGPANEHFVVWQRQSGTTVEIWFASKVSGVWSTPQILANWTKGNTLPINTYPQMIAVYDRFSGESESLASIMITYMNGGPIWKISADRGSSWSTYGPMTGEFSSRIDGTNGKIDYAWSAGEGIGIAVYFERNNSDGSSNTYVGVVPGSAANYSGESLETRESHISDIRNSFWDRQHLTWWKYEFGDASIDHYYVAAQSYRLGVWSSVWYWETGVPATRASIGTAIDNTALMWSEGTQLKKVTASNESGTWSSIENIGQGQFPVLQYGYPGSNPTYFSIQAGSPLNTITPGTTTLSKSTQSLTQESRLYSRVIFAVDTTTLETFSVKMTQPMLNGIGIPLVAVDDTLPGINANNFYDYLRAEVVGIGSDNDTLSFDLSITSMGMKERSFPLSFNIDGVSNDGKIGEVVEINEVLKDTVKFVPVKTVVKNLSGKQFSLKPVGISLEDLGPNWVFGLAHVFDLPKGTRNFAHETNELTAPSTSGLASNYPNPFNPTTDLGYQLSGPAVVILKIYDMLGREIKTLVNEEKDAGYYSARFDGSGLASGIYFARISITPTATTNAPPIIQSVKMLLAK